MHATLLIDELLGTGFENGAPDFPPRLASAMFPPPFIMEHARPVRVVVESVRDRVTYPGASQLYGLWSTRISPGERQKHRSPGDIPA